MNSNICIGNVRSWQILSTQKLMQHLNQEVTATLCSNMYERLLGLT